MRPAAIAALIAVTLLALSTRGGAPARAITGPMGVVQTYMGTGTAGNTGDGGAPTAAEIDGPGAIAIAPNGDLYVSSGCVVRRVHDSVVSTVADVCSYSPPPLTGIAVSPAGEVYFAMYCVIMKVTTSAPVVAYGTLPCAGSSFQNINAITFDRAGNLYIADWGHCAIEKVDAAGVMSFAVAKLGLSAFECDNRGDGGPATAARLGWPLGIAVSDNGDLYVAVGDGSIQSRIRKVSHGIITTVAGGGPCCALGDGGPATSATMKLRYDRVAGVVVDATGDLYIADTANCRVRRVSHGIITTIAGTGTDPCASGGDGGDALASSMGPVDLAFDSDGTLFIADGDNKTSPYKNNRVRTIFGVALDTDQDGYTDRQETAIGKDPSSYCPIMRADVDGDGAVSILDLSKVAGFFGQSVPPAPPRYRQGPPPFGSAISILDLSKMAMLYQKPVSACP